LLWAVIFAVGFAALAPSVSAWLAARSNVTTEVCSAEGARLVVWSGASHEDPAPGLMHKHCPYCLLQQDHATPPASSLQVASAPLLRLTLQRWTVHALPYQQVAWALLPAHAPPSFS